MNEYRIIVTNHSKTRARQRLKLFLRPHELSNIEAFIRAEFKLAHKCVRLNNVPFLRNTIGEVFVTKFVKFYCTTVGDKIIIKSLIKNRGEWRY